MLYDKVDLSQLEPGTVVHVNTHSGWYHIGITKSTSVDAINDNLVTGIFVTSTCEYYVHCYYGYAQDGYYTLDPGNIKLSRHIVVDEPFRIDITQGRILEHLTRPVKLIISR